MAPSSAKANASAAPPASSQAMKAGNAAPAASPGCRRSACRWSRPAGDRSAGQRRPPTATAISMPGQCGRTIFSASDDGDRRQRDHQRAELTSAWRATSASSFGTSARLLAGKRQPEQILDLAREDDHGDAGGESDRHRIGDEFDVGAEAAGSRPRAGSGPPSAWPAAGHRSRAARRSPPPAR